MTNDNRGPEVLDLSRAPHGGPLEPRQWLPAPGYAPQAQAPEANASLTRFLEVIREHKWKIMSFVALSMVVATVLSLTLEKLYESEVRIKLDRNQVGGVIGQEASQVLPVNDMDQIMATQLEVIQSDAVLRPVVEKFHLLDLEKQTKGMTPERAKAFRAGPISLKRLKITRPPNTYILKLSYRAKTPQLAADITNALAESYIAHAYDSKNRSFAEVSALISHQLAELRARMAVSQTALGQYERELNMIDPEQRVSILSKRLDQLNTEYTASQEDRLKKEAVLNSLADPTLAAAQAATTGADSSLERTMSRLSEAKQHFAFVKSTFGDSHPEYRKAKDQVAELEQQVSALRLSTRDRVQADYSQTLGREQRLHKVVEDTKVEMDRQNARVLQYSQLKRDAENDKKLYEDLDRRTREADINKSFHDAVISIIDPALPPSGHIFPSLPLNLALALVLSSVLAIGGAVLMDAVDTTLSDAEEAARRLNVNVIATLPTARNLPSAASLASESDNPIELAGGSRKSVESAARHGEAIRSLRNTIEIANMDRRIRSVLITSSNPNEGKSTIAAHLAVSFAQIGRKVLLIDADLRRPTVHRHFSLTGATGLSDILTGAMSWRDAMLRIEPHQLYVIPAGPVSRRASDLIGPGIADLLETISREFDLVIVDSPPMLGFAESQQLAGVVDSVIVVAKAGTTSGKEVGGALAALFRSRANVMGLVINQTKASLAAGYAYYDTRYSQR